MFGRNPPQRQGLTLICTLQGMLPAQVIKTKLEAAGIPALLEYESAGQAIGVTIDGLGAVHVYVPSDLAGDAQNVVDVQGPPDDSEMEIED